ncbi:MAG: glycosyltransferase family 4 protein [Flavobacteriales bacterium]|nr:glycosyltransferase family 4 protein [Flavobacteriales bacterium]
MKIGYDAKRLFLNSSGLGNYSRWLCREIRSVKPDYDIHLFTPGINPNRDDINKTFKASDYSIHLPPNLFKAFWRSKGIKKDLLRNNIELYHGLSNELPIGIEKTGIKTVVTIHDLIFRVFPEHYGVIDRKIYDRKFRSACERADRIVAVSHHTAEQIRLQYAIPEEKISVIYMDADYRFLNKPTVDELESMRKKFRIHRPFYMCTGGYGGRKNQKNILEAFAKVSNLVGKDLYFIGKKNKGFQEFENLISELKLEHRVKWLENVSDEDLHMLYHLCHANIFTSLYEGFGIPIVESFRSGKPVITSYGSSLEEVAGSAGLLCDPENINDIADKILEIEKSDVYHNLKNNIKEELDRFDSQKLITKYVRVYEKLLES